MDTCRWQEGEDTCRWQEGEDTCRWQEGEAGNYETNCKNVFVILEGTPEENGFRFCPYCGRYLEEVVYREETNCSECHYGTDDGVCCYFGSKETDPMGQCEMFEEKS